MNEPLEHIIATTSSGGLKQLNLQSGAVEKQFIVKEDPSICVQRGIFIGENYFYFIGLHSHKALLYFWDLHKNESIFRQSLPEKLMAITCCHSGLLAFAGSENGTLFVWQMSTGRLVNSFKAHFSSIEHLKITSDDAVLLTASADADIKAYLLTDLCTHGQPSSVRHYKGHAGAIMAITGSYEGPFSPFCCFITASVDRSVMCWSWESDRSCAKFLFPNSVNCLALENSQASVYAGCEDGNIYSLSMMEAAKQSFDSSQVCVVDSLRMSEKIFIGHCNGVKDMAVTYDMEILASCGSDGIRLWHIPTRVQLKYLTFVGETITSLCLVIPSLRQSALPMFSAFQRTFAASETSHLANNTHLLKMTGKDSELHMEKMKNQQLTTLLKSIYSDSR
ncbi:WD domain, G-beta repeat-containing protein [Cardiosporidium cionae]|uniref:WD domain, G-beta repeat-containing protein n=1 Tax=Cardiosporidium cionae TaxID=476202 RepID=A0ABQ7J6Y5_9APIC|nr:WD domain, G-beta repeat-containing protein [Cardiosporidium cionae]|eukprot:KAF8819750.1 WD domain, G-beta repeat-containing protein [Cardiosporidium cionae]